MVRVLSMRDTFGDAGSYLIGDADGLVFDRIADEDNNLSTEVDGIIEQIKIKKTRRVEKPKVKTTKVSTEVVSTLTFNKSSTLSKKGKRG